MTHYLLQQRHESWASLESQIENLPSAQEKGEVFEQFVFSYLIINKDYYQIDKVYRGKDIPASIRDEFRLESTDYGVDGIFTLSDGTVAAYQAKFRSNRGSATVRELATFWSEASRADYKYVIANAVELPRQAGKHGYSILADKFDELNEEFFSALYELSNHRPAPAVELATPDTHQQRMIENTISGFKQSDRGRLIAACGAGKTLTSLWIVEAMPVDTVLILVPSLALIKQTLESWSKQKREDFTYLCICSDQSVVDAKEMDYGEYEVSEIDFPVTTDREVIQKFLKAETNSRKYIFSTYNSAQSIAESVPDAFKFDLIIFDEAHRTAGQKDSNMYSIALKDSGIPARKRLFMTATERLVQPWIINKAAEANRVIFSMDDESIYGSVFDRYTFGEAIQDGVISDYKIVLTAITASEVGALIKDNRLIIAEDDEKERLLTAQNIYKQSVLHKAMQRFNIKKTITFHSSVKRAKAFVNGSGVEAYGLMDLYRSIWPEITGQNLYFDWVDGSMPTGLRKMKMREFENSDVGIIANAKCLTEGVDVPIIDSIYFVDPKTSLVDIVQACGRALRKSRNQAEQKVAYFVVPIIISEYDDSGDPILDTGKFETLFNLIQALRNQDERMADWIDKINMNHVKGGGGESQSTDEPIVIDFPQEFDLSKFSKQIQVRIFEGVKGPQRPETTLAFKVRRSNFRKVFKALGDYSFSSYIDNLVVPTVDKFTDITKEMSPADIKIVNNNVSHTQRLGLIDKNSAGNYILTQLGRDFSLGNITATDIFVDAMLKYDCGTNGSPLFPYRAALDILMRVETINKVEFLYGIYSLQDTSEQSIEESVARIATIRDNYANILSVNDANKTVVLNELNEMLGENFSEADLWASTTATNKFIYFKNHLSLIDGVSANATEISLVSSKMQYVNDLLESTMTDVDY